MEGLIMKYSELVERRIPGEGDQLARRKELWSKIDSIYKKEGEHGIKSFMLEKSNIINKEFNELLRQLKAKL
jgi:hypothetical protein